jgi:hypothetical protein
MQVFNDRFQAESGVEFHPDFASSAKNLEVAATFMQNVWAPG